jgi:protein gp37
MSDHTKIEWTDATWNVITGCSVISPGCTNCYAMRLAGTRLKHTPSRRALTRDTKAGPVWTGEMRFNEQWLTQPLKWPRPRMIFVCAHGDLFHESVPNEWIDRVFAVMALAPQHTFQVLTKRAKRMRAYIAEHHSRNGVELAAERIKPSKGLPVSPKWCFQWPLPNVWLGVSAEDQTRADERVPELLATPAAVRFVSCEPLLGPIDLIRIKLQGVVDPFDAFVGATWSQPASLNGARFFSSNIERKDRPRLDWVIVGGESGPYARPMHPDWVRSLRDQCAAADVPFFFKQWGEWADADDFPSETQEHYDVLGLTERMNIRVGKRAAGRDLDGRTWDEMPETVQRTSPQARSNPTAKRPHQDAAMKIVP